MQSPTITPRNADTDTDARMWAIVLEQVRLERSKVPDQLSEVRSWLKVLLPPREACYEHDGCSQHVNPLKR